MKIKQNKKINFGLLKIKPTSNNIFITLTDFTGNVILSKHGGSLKFKGAKKRTSFVAGLIIKDLFAKLKKLNIKIKCIIAQVHGHIRNNAVHNVMKQLRKLRIRKIIYIEYINKKVHNGLRPKKKRRL